MSSKRLLLGYSDEDFETLFMRGELNFDILGSNEDYTWEVNASGDLELNKDGTIIATFDTDKVVINNLISSGVNLGTTGKGKIAGDPDGTGNLTLLPPNELSSKLFLTGVTKTQIESLGITGLKSGGFDQTNNLNKLMDNTTSILTNMGFDTDAGVKIIVESEKGYLFFNDRIRMPDRVSLEFKSPIVVGNLFSLRLHGNTQKEPNALADAPTIDATFADGVSTVTFVTNGFADVAGLPWAAGDLMNIRDASLDTSTDNIIQSIALVSGTQFTVTFTEPIDNDGNSLVAGDQIRRFAQATLSSTTLRGDSKLTIAAGFNDFKESDYCHIRDQRKAGDFTGNPVSNGTRDFWFSNNFFRFESFKIVKKSGSDYFVDRPLSHDYDDITKAYIIKVRPRHHQTIENLLVVQIEEPPNVAGVFFRQNRHIIHLEDCIDCKVINCTFTDNYDELDGIDQFPTADNAIRIRESYHCEVLNCTIDRSNRKYSFSGASYGWTLYFSTSCNIIGGTTSTLRHNILLQGATNCNISNVSMHNPLISGIDLHGLGSRDNTFNNIQINVNGTLTLDDTNTSSGNSTIAAVRVGNSFHPVGDSFNNFNDIVVNIGNIDDTDVTDVYGIEIECPSSNNTFQNCRIYGTNQTGTTKIIGLQIKDYNRERILVKCFNNQFIDCYVENCEDNAVFLDGADAYRSAKEAFNTGTFTENAPTTTTLILPPTLSNAPSEDPLTYDKYFGGGNVTFEFASVSKDWNIQFTSGSNNLLNRLVTNYDSSTRTCTLSGTINTGINGDTFEIVDTTVVSSFPVENTKFIGNTFVRNNVLVGSSFTRDTAFISNTFDTNIVKDNSNKYVFDLDGDTDFRILNNVTYNCSRFTKINQVANFKMFSNKVLEPQENTVFETTGSLGSTLEVANNRYVGFNPAFILGTADTYTSTKERIGYNNEPDGIALVVQNSSGKVGIGTDSPSKELSVVGTVTVTSKLGIGTTNPAQELEVVGDVIISQDLNVATDLLFVDASLNRVGINNATPLTTLDVIGNIQTDGDIFATGSITSTRAGQLVNSVFISQRTIITAQHNSGTYNVVVTIAYIREAASSKIWVTYDGDMSVNGTGADVFETRIFFATVGGNSKFQQWTDGNGGGTRGITCLPIGDVFTSTSSGSLLIEVKARRASGDDTMTFSGLNTLIIHEIAN